MPELVPEFELTDKVGETLEFVDTVNQFGVLLPPVADKRIDEVSIKCQIDQTGSKRLEFSLNGIKWYRLAPGDSREEEPRGEIRQIHVRSNGSPNEVIYEVVMNVGAE